MYISIIKALRILEEAYLTLPNPGTLLLLAHFMKLSQRNMEKFRVNERTKGVEKSFLFF